MKKTIIFFLVTVFMLMSFSACKKKDDNVIRLNEVTHSVFYAPLYLAIENKYFEEENLKIELTNGGGADNSMTAVLSKTADIGLMGPETAIYVYNQNKADMPKVFAGLTQKDGSFLVSRNKEPDFDWKSLKNKDILAGRKGGVPAMTFEYILKNEGYTLGTDYTLNFGVQFNLMTSAFIGGTSDYCTVFEPTASEYEKNGTWHIVASVGEKGGEIPYTTFIALDSFIKNNGEKIKGFVKAIFKAIEFMDSHTDKEIAEAIVKQFPQTSINSLEDSVKNYKKIDAWNKTLIPTEESFDRLFNIMINAGELTNKVEYNKFTSLEITEKIIKK